MRFFGLKSCDTCRKALKTLAQAGHSPEVIDVRAQGVPAETLSQIVATFGDAAMNKASTTWRGLTDEQKSQDPLSLLSEHPALMKRPMIEQDGRWTMGWKPDVQALYLSAKD